MAKRDFEKFKVSLEGKEFECDPENELLSSEENINDDLKNQPGWYAWYAVLQEKADHELQESKLMLEIFGAELDAKIRSTHESLTEKKITAMILMDEDYHMARRMVNDSKHKVGVLKAVKESFDHRKDMLITLASNMRKQMDPDIYIKKEEFKQED